MLQLFLDVETKKTFDDVGGFFPHKLGVSFVGVCARQGFSGTGEMLGFFENQLDDLIALIEKADMIVGYNIINFDMPTLSPYYKGDIDELPILDLLVRFKDATGHRVKLDVLAKESLGTGKIGDGLDAIRYYETGQLDKLKKYCLKDVEVTRDIYDYGMRYGKVKYTNKWNRKIETPIDFSFNLAKNSGVQMTLL